MKQPIQWKFLIGQERVKTLLNSAVASNTLSHAYLFCGDDGIGKFAAALDLAATLLCEKQDNAPCGACASCQRVMIGQHPDFHVLMPLGFQSEHIRDKNNRKEFTQAGYDFIAENVAKKCSEPYQISPGMERGYIPVHWVREVDHAIQRGPTNGPWLIVIIDCIDIMEDKQFNAFLKTLEEPPPQTIIIGITDHAGDVPPTIVSRCQVVRFGSLDEKEIRAELIHRGHADAAAERIDDVIRYAAGSLGRALDLMESDLPALLGLADEVFLCCRNRDWNAAVGLMERLSGDAALMDTLFRYGSWRARDRFFEAVSQSPTYFKDASEKKEVAERLASALALLEAGQRGVAALQAHGNSGLLLLDFLAGMMEHLHEQKQ